MTARHIFCVVWLAGCCCVGCGGPATESKATGDQPVAAAPEKKAPAPVRPTSQTPMQRRLNSVGYDERVKIWAKRFDKPESWVRKHTSANDSASDAETRLIRARVQKKRLTVRVSPSGD